MGDASCTFTFAGVHEAPNASGVFRIYNSARWVYVGESDDIRHSPFQLLNDSPSWMNRFGPLSFSFERMPPAERAAFQQAAVKALHPAQQSA